MAIDGYESKINTIRGALSRITVTGQPIPDKEWKVLDEQLIGGSGGQYSKMAQEIAQEMGISPEMAQAYIERAMKGTSTGVSRRE